MIFKEMYRNKYFFASLSVITFFVFIVSSLIVYVQNNYTVTSSCGCEVSIYWILLVIASIGLFSGSITYIMLTKSIEKKDLDLDKFKRLFYNCLEKDEENIVKNLVNNNGENYQSNISKECKIDKVKLHRKLKDLEDRQIIKRKKHSMTYIIYLNDDIKDFLI